MMMYGFVMLTVVIRACQVLQSPTVIKKNPYLERSWKILSTNHKKVMEFKIITNVVQKEWVDEELYYFLNTMILIIDINLQDTFLYLFSSTLTIGSLHSK